MKITVIIDNKIGAGGGFDQALNAVLQMQRLCEHRFIFEVMTSQKENLELFRGLGIKCTFFSYSLFDRLLVKFSPSKIWQIIQSKLKFIAPFEKKLILNDCDLVYFVTPTNKSATLQVLNYIVTVWDISHRDTPEFPEVREFNTFYIREEHYKNNLGPALLILTDSEKNAKQASNIYGIDYRRFIPMPFSPSPFLDKKKSLNKDEILNKYAIEEDYFYYPAQFWAHKNHISILKALLILRKQHNWFPKVVFTGKDYGNLGYLKKFVLNNGLTSQVKFLGFVPSEDIRALYEGALAIVMPTYFGPTNLPPLEAWAIGKPLLYSSHFVEQTGNAALLFNPDSAEELANALRLCTDKKILDQLSLLGKIRLEEIAEARNKSEQHLINELEVFAIRRMCWE
jgi:glycosyltransferase involved in cell wall biosynthesis